MVQLTSKECIPVLASIVAVRHELVTIIRDIIEHRFFGKEKFTN